MSSAYRQAIPSIPKETARAASASFGRGNFYIQVGEQLDSILEELHWQQSHEWRGGFATAEDLSLALITLFQFMEGLTDAQASDALRTRIDWKFALHLPLLPRTLDEIVLCQFRERMLNHAIEQYAYQMLLDGLIRSVPRLTSSLQLPGSLEMVSQVCSVNRLDQVQQAMNRVLEVLAARFPEWLRAITPSHWYGRYNPSLHRWDGTLPSHQQRSLMEEIGSDIQYLLEKVRQPGLLEIGELNEIRILEQVWLQQVETLEPELPGLFNPENCATCSLKTAGWRTQA